MLTSTALALFIPTCCFIGNAQNSSIERSKASTTLYCRFQHGRVHSTWALLRWSPKIRMAYGNESTMVPPQMTITWQPVAVPSHRPKTLNLTKTRRPLAERPTVPVSEEFVSMIAHASISLGTPSWQIHSIYSTPDSWYGFSTARSSTTQESLWFNRIGHTCPSYIRALRAA